MYLPGTCIDVHNFSIVCMYERIIVCLLRTMYITLELYLCVFVCRCKDLYLLETYTTDRSEDIKLPDFLDIYKEVTDDPEYSMSLLSLK